MLPRKKFEELLLTNATVDHKGFCWIGGYNYGLIKFDPRTHSFQIFETGRTDNQILAIEEGWDENGERILWVGDNHGLGIFRPNQISFTSFPIFCRKHIRLTISIAIQMELSGPVPPVE